MKPNELFSPTDISQEAARAASGDADAALRAGFGYFTGSAGMMNMPKSRKYFGLPADKSPAAFACLGFLDPSAGRVERACY